MGMMTGVSSPEERTRTFVLRQRVIPVPQSISTRFDGKDPSGTLLQQTAISTTTTTSSLSSSSSSENPTTTTAQLRVLGEMVVNEEKSFTIMLTVLVSFILIFFVICTYQVMRIWLCKVICRRDVRPVVAETNADGTDTMLVHEGRVFNLTGHQRRAVLEAIFSETSKAVTDQDVVNEKKTKKRKKRNNSHDLDIDDEDEIMPMDAVEIPAVSTTGTDLSIGRSNHQNLSPTDSFGDVEIGTPRTCPDTSDEASPLGLSATRSGEQMQPPVDVSATKSGEQMQFFSNVEDGNGAAIPLRLPCSGSFDDHSDMGMDDHLYKDSGSLSEGEEDETGWKRDAVFGSDSQETDLDQNISSPALSHDRKQPPEKVRDDDVQSTGSHGLLPNPSSMDGALASFDGVWDMTVSTSFPGSPILFSHSNGGESMKSANGMASDDDLSDNEQDFPTRRALFRGDPAVSGLANSEGSANEERKKENGQTETEIPPIEQVPSNDSYGSFCEYITPSNLQIPIPMTKRESFATITSEYTYDDDSTTGDNVCPICLCGYKKGDMLVVSNHCTHCFHKDCILEWLDKHDECPICRVNMITDSELSRAATSLVGKTRMYRAVATMQTSSSRGNSRYHRSPNAATGANPSGPSPLGGTVRSSAAGSRTPPRGYQNPRAFS